MNSIGKKIDSEFENMFFTAQEICKENRQKNEEYGLCLILKTKQEEKSYFFSCDTVKELIAQCCSIITQDKITVVRKIVCMWKSGAIDVPPLNFRKVLCDINPENEKTEILLNADHGYYVIKTISELFP